MSLPVSSSYCLYTAAVRSVRLLSVVNLTGSDWLMDPSLCSYWLL
jgi:hypothetical protein